MKKNNKGFSLVELIVVVLIMGILAVALAPQVMKWVANSRVSADNNNYDSLYSAAQLALTDSAAYTYMKDTASDDFVITMGEGSTTLTDTTSAYAKAFIAVAPEYSNIRRRTGSADYKITIAHGTPTVTKTAAPQDGGSIN